MNGLTIAYGASLIADGIGSVILGAYLVGALLSLMHGRKLSSARRVIATGAVTALNWKTGATLLVALDLGSWQAIATLASIASLRLLLQSEFRRELQSGDGTSIRGLEQIATDVR